MRRRILVNIGLVLVLFGICVVCFLNGKAYKVVLENVPYIVDGVEQPAIEAMQVTIDPKRNPVYLLADDRMVGTAIGNSQILMMELLDEEDNVIETKNVEFEILDLGGHLNINVARAWNTGKLVEEE